MDVPSPTPSLEALTPVRQRGLTDAVYDTLLGMLTSGAFAPDAPLSIDRLARNLQVSPTPVREALARLEHTGLVERTARRGYRVAPPMSAEQMRELADARLVLEVGALERANVVQHEGLLTDMGAALAAHRHAAERFADPTLVRDLAAVQEYFAADWAFHQAILDHCGNRYINRSANALSFSVHRMRQSIGAHTTDAPIAVAEHTAIYDALRSGSTAEAVAALTTHLRNVAVRSTEDEQ